MLNQVEQKLFNKFLRLSMQRDLYTIPQAAFRMGISRNQFESTYVKTGMIMLRLRGAEKLVPRTELEKAIEMMPLIVSKDIIKYKPKMATRQIYEMLGKKK